VTTLRERRQERLRAARPAIAWTLGSFAVAILIALAATAGLAEAGQACFLGDTPCPDATDPRFGWLLFAFAGVPLIWLLGLLLLAVRSPTRFRG
jgi:hypothetical protein